MSCDECGWSSTDPVNSPSDGRLHILQELHRAVAKYAFPNSTVDVIEMVHHDPRRIVDVDGSPYQFRIESPNTADFSRRCGQLTIVIRQSSNLRDLRPRRLAHEWPRIPGNSYRMGAHD